MTTVLMFGLRISQQTRFDIALTNSVSPTVQIIKSGSIWKTPAFVPLGAVQHVSETMTVANCQECIIEISDVDDAAPMCEITVSADAVFMTSDVAFEAPCAVFTARTFAAIGNPKNPLPPSLAPSGNTEEAEFLKSSTQRDLRDRIDGTPRGKGGEAAA